MTLVYLAAAWMAGVLLAHQIELPVWSWLIAALPMLIGVLVIRERRELRLLLSCGILLVGGAARYAASVPVIDEHTLAAYNDQGYVTLSGTINEMPDVRDTHVNLRIEVDSLRLDDGTLREVEGRLLAQAPRDEYHYGERVQVSGQLETPAEFDTFSYRDYLAREKVYSVMYYARVEPTGGTAGSPIRAALIDFRERAHGMIGQLLPDPQAALLSGILLGIENRISPDVREAFNAVGATHVIAISGSNLVILAGIIQALASRLIKRPVPVAAITIAGIVGYAIFVGGDAAVIRAAIMTSLALVAGQVGRQTYGLASLSFAAVLMSAINPLVLWDVGFQLSFLATLGLVLYVDPLQKLAEKGLNRVLPKERAREVIAVGSDAFLVTIAAQITTTPIMAYTFGRFSLLSLPVNLLIIPAQTPLMVLGGLGVLAALVWWPLGQVLAWGSWLFLSWTIAVVRLFAGLPFASLPVTDISPLAVWLIYGVMFGVTALAMQPSNVRQRLLDRVRQALGTKLLAGAGLSIAALLFVSAGSLPDGRLHVTFIDVGDGSATLIETPSGRQILIDAGGSGRQLRSALGDALPFWDRRIDLLVLTEADGGQTDALADVLERYSFDGVMVSAVPEELAEVEIQIVEPVAGATINVEDGVRLMVLSAPPAGMVEDAEPISLMLTYGDVRMLLPGDVSEVGEGALLSSGADLQAAVLHVPRSGHRDVSQEAFLAAVNPQIAVISVERDNRYGLPHDETLTRIEAAGAVLYRIDQHGTVRLVTDSSEMWVRTAN